MTSSERKEKTETLLKSLNIPFIDNLPLIEEENEVKLRTPIEIAKRILVLTYLCYVAEVPKDNMSVINFLKQQDLWECVSRDEKQLFQKELTDLDLIDVSWRSEAIWILLWTINKVNDLELPIEEIIISDILDLLPDFKVDTKEFINTATIRTVSEILDQSDLIYRLHWATRNSVLGMLNAPNINSDIVSERHYAINWVTCQEENWDDITTDT